MGSYCSVTNDLRKSTMFIKYGPNLTAIGIAEIISGFLSMVPEIGEVFHVIGTGLAVAQGVSQGQLDAIKRASVSELKGKYNLGERGPGETYTSDKMSLSLTMSAIIVVVDMVPPSTPGGSNGQVILKSGTMSVWTAPNDGGTYQYFLSKFYQEPNATNYAEHEATALLEDFKQQVADQKIMLSEVKEIPASIRTN